MTITAEQRKTLLLVGFLGVLAFGVILWYWFVFGAKEVADATKAKETTLAEKKKVDDDLATFEAFKRDVMDAHVYDAVKNRLAKMESRLPKDEEAFGFFEALDEILNKTSVSDERLEKEKTLPEIRYTEIPYSIRAVGRYHEFGQFLDLVENNDRRFMRVKTFTIGDDPKRPTLHPIEVEIATYTFATHD